MSDTNQTQDQNLNQTEAKAEGWDDVKKADDEEPDFLAGVKACTIDNPTCEACQ